MSQVRSITVTTVSGGEQTVQLQNYNVQNIIEFWGDSFDRALSGKHRQRVRGQRERFVIDYESCIEQSEYRTLFNNIVTDLLNGREDFTVYEDGDSSELAIVVPSEDFIQQIEYSRQIGNFVPRMEFVTKELNATLGETYVEAGYVQVGYVQ